VEIQTHAKRVPSRPIFGSKSAAAVRLATFIAAMMSIFRLHPETIRRIAAFLAKEDLNDRRLINCETKYTSVPAWVVPMV